MLTYHRSTVQPVYMNHLSLILHLVGTYPTVDTVTLHTHTRKREREKENFENKKLIN